MQFVNPKMLAFLWFGTIFIGSSIAILLHRRTEFISNVKKHWKDGLIVGGINGVGVTFFFFALSLLEASTMAFLVRFSTIFTVILGVLLLKERLTRYELIGILVAVGGALLINYNNGTYTTIALIAALAAALAIASHQIVAKIFVKRIHPLHLVNIRVLFTTVILFAITFFTSNMQPVPLNIIPILLIVAGVLGVLGFVFFYKSLELIDVSKAAVIRTLDPFFVVIYSFILFRTFPNVQELLGGILIVAGVIIIVLKHRIAEFASSISAFKL